MQSQINSFAQLIFMVHEYVGQYEISSLNITLYMQYMLYYT